MSFLDENHGSNAVVPVPGGAAKHYIDGTALKHYDFAFQAVMELSQTTDSVNTDNLFLLRRWQAWIDEQEHLGNFPDFGERCSGYHLENLADMPQLAQVYDGKTAKYQFPARLYYVERRSAPKRSAGEGVPP